MDRPQRLARKAEQKTAELHGGRVTPQSGSGRAVKNDVRNGTWSFEVKSTGRLGYTLNRDALRIAEKNAMQDGRRMAFLVDFLRNPGQKNGKRYIVTTEDDFLEREQELAELKGSIAASIKESEAAIEQARLRLDDCEQLLSVKKEQEQELESLRAFVASLREHGVID